MKARTKVDFSVIKKVLFKKGGVTMTMDEAAKKVGCTREELTEILVKHLEDEVARLRVEQGGR
jgi:hypothetical protein